MMQSGWRRVWLGLCLGLGLGLGGMPQAQAAEGGDGGPLELEVDTIDGGHFSLAQQRGKWVVVNYWATWCTPCIKEMPELKAFDQSRQDVALVGLAYEEISVEEMQAFLRQHPAGYPIAIVDVYAPPAAFGAPRGLPMTWLLSPEGRVAKRFLGPVTGRDLAEAIDGAGAAVK